MGHVDHDHLPIDLALVDHRKRCQRLTHDHGAGRHTNARDVDHIHRIIVAAISLKPLPDVFGLFPCLWERAVVPLDIDIIVAWLTFLLVLLDRVGPLDRVHLILRRGVLRDLNESMHRFGAGTERQVMPVRDLHVVVVDDEPAPLEASLFASITVIVFVQHRHRFAACSPLGCTPHRSPIVYNLGWRPRTQLRGLLLQAPQAAEEWVPPLRREQRALLDRLLEQPVLIAA
mmetsp:Transcript_68996/g.153959  ORF Transcript_68996/g.153959 Transcript_68996/m.153959 type:complete len:230 (-) Transcript_68996:27-716(-)